LALAAIPAGYGGSELTPDAAFEDEIVPPGLLGLLANDSMREPHLSRLQNQAEAVAISVPAPKPLDL